MSSTKPFQILILDNLDFHAHWHSDVEIIYLIEGCTYIGVNDQKRLVKKGEFVICGSGDIHYLQPGEHNSKVFVIIFKPEILFNTHTWPVDSQFSSSFIHGETLDYKHISMLSKIIDLIIQQDFDKLDSYELFIKAHLIEICAYLNRYFPKTTVAKGRNMPIKLSHMQEILSYIESHFKENITVEGLSKTFSISLYHFSRLFNIFTGTNFKTYLNTLRVSAAEEEIINSEDSITDIALKCGFDSLRTFNRAYKKIKGCAPSHMRKPTFKD